jgi:HrpA-like RNA helicase
VVVASATIDPVKFLNHFELKTTPLRVEGRVFNVDVVYEPEIEVELE